MTVHVDHKQPPVWHRRPDLADFPGLGRVVLEIATWSA